MPMLLSHWNLMKPHDGVSIHVLTYSNKLSNFKFGNNFPNAENRDSNTN